MERSESLKIVKKLGLRIPSLLKNLEMQAEWAVDIYTDFGGESFEWVLAESKDILKKRGGEYDPKLDWFLSELRCRVNLRRYLALPKPEEEDEAEVVYDEEATAQFAKIREIVAKALPGKEEIPDLLTRARSKSCDDYVSDNFDKPDTVED